MKFPIQRTSILLSIIFLISCASQPLATPQPTQTSPSSEEIKAAHALGTFLRLLNEKNYADAAALYGGDYEQLQVFNPDVNANDQATLWQRACEMSGLQCLTMRTAKLTHHENNMYVFQVEFSNPDGSLFVLGPCCGANETEMPHVSQFEYKVARSAEGKFLVMDLPPYVP